MQEGVLNFHRKNNNNFFQFQNRFYIFHQRELFRETVV